MAKTQHQYSILLILLSALAVRVVHVNWGLPELYEEAFPLAISWKFWNWGHAGLDMNPHFFNYPALTFLLNFLIQVGHFSVGSVAGVYSTLASFQQSYAADPTISVILARLLSVAFDAGSVYVVYKIGREIGSDAVALLAATLCALCPLLMKQSQFINVDSALTFFSTLSLLFLSRILTDPKRRWYLLAGMSIGLAASSKYNGALLLVIMAAAHIVGVRSAQKSSHVLPFQIGRAHV